MLTSLLDWISQAPEHTSFEAPRQAMVEKQIRRRGVRDERVLDAMRRVPRHWFVPLDMLYAAYEDEPIAIGEGQTLSQPYVVASMTEVLGLSGTERVLEVGAGSGYQAAVLSLLSREVIALESVSSLAESARTRLAQLGYANVRIECADGSRGLPDAAPFDAILVAAAAPSVPPPLLEQLAEGGRMVIPVGCAEMQTLLVVWKEGGRIRFASLYPCRFVPLRGLHGWPSAKS